MGQTIECTRKCMKIEPKHMGVPLMNYALNKNVFVMSYENLKGEKS